MRVPTKKRGRPAKKKPRPARKSLKGRITPAIGASITAHGRAGRGPREIAQLVSEEHELEPPLSHVAVIRFLDRSLALAPAAVAPVENVSAGELLKREALNLVGIAAKFAEGGNAAAYLRSVSTLAAVLKTTESIAAADRKREGSKHGLADLLSTALAKDIDRRETAPGDWLLDAVPRVLADLLEVADALQAVPMTKRAELGRPLVAALETLGAAALS